MKHCPTCDIEKERSAFNLDNSKPDKRQSLCRECQRGNYARGTNKVRAAVRNAEYRETQAKKRRAHHVVENDLRQGRLQKAGCEVCGAGRADAHHDDYDQPSNVRWLCRSHHLLWHRDNPDGVRGLS